MRISFHFRGIKYWYGRFQVDLPFLGVIKLVKPEAFGEAGDEKVLPTRKVAFLLRRW